MATFLAVVLLVMTIELWLPLAFIFGAIKLMTSFSLAESWLAFKGVPLWIWDFVHSALT
jgi:hypothetical protein